MSSFIQDLQKGAGEIKKTGQTNIVISGEFVAAGKNSFLLHGQNGTGYYIITSVTVNQVFLLKKGKTNDET